jgi:hypothetical protein
VHRNDHVREVMKVIKEVRMSPTLSANLGIDEVKIGRQILLKMVAVDHLNNSFDIETVETVIDDE